MSEARAGAEARDDEVSFVLGSVAHTRNGDMLTDDDVSDAVSIDLSTRGGELTRAELLPALARIQLDDRDGGTAPATVEELSDGEDSDEADCLRSIVKLPLPAAAHVPLHPPPFQKPTRLLSATLWALEESPRRLDAEELLLTVQAQSCRTTAGLQRHLARARRRA